MTPAAVPTVASIVTQGDTDSKRSATPVGLQSKAGTEEAGVPDKSKEMSGMGTKVDIEHVPVEDDPRQWSSFRKVSWLILNSQFNEVLKHNALDSCTITDFCCFYDSRNSR